MKRSPTSSCSSSSSSSCVGSDVLLPDHQTEKPKIKRPRKNQAKEKCCHPTNHNNSNNNNNNNNNNASSPNSSGRRSSIYRGVTRHRWTGRFEAHLWDKSSWNNIQNKKGKQVYLGAYDCEEAAARTYDLAALKYWGPETTLNFPIENYKKELEEMQKVSKEEYLASLRRRSSGFSRGVSKYRGVARHHHNGRWEARIGRVFGNKYLYLGTYNTQEEAAAAYDMAAIEYRGANAVTNFDVSHYIERLKKKGILLFDHNQDPLPNSSTESEETEADAEVEQPQPQPGRQQQPALLLPHQEQDQQEIASTQLQYTQLPQCLDATTCAMMVTDPGDEHELTWSFCLDTAVGLTPHPVPDIPLGNAGELLDMFDDTGFEDNIDLIFGTEEIEGCNNNIVVENEEGNINNMEHSTSCGVSGNMDEDSEKIVVSRLLSDSSSNSSPSSSSTTTSISCNYCV